MNAFKHLNKLLIEKKQVEKFKKLPITAVIDYCSFCAGRKYIFHNFVLSIGKRRVSKDTTEANPHNERCYLIVVTPF